MEIAFERELFLNVSVWVSAGALALGLDSTEETSRRKPSGAPLPSRASVTIA